jgi:hypothetical protein
MFRFVFSALFSLLLISAQAAEVVHEVDHLRAKIEHGHGANFEKPSPGACLECELLASGSSAAPLPIATIAFAAAESTPVASSFEPSPALPPPAFYQSRAPPQLR